MSTAVALLSGKGGSGKTTLALSLANLLCRCGTKTLLVDCDLSTNGATFFYESQLYEWSRTESHHVFSFSDILSVEKNRIGPIPLNPTLLKIKDSLDFIPSISEISDRNFQGTIVQYNSDMKYLFADFLGWAKGRYEVILFDCQAGYSEFFPALLPMLDADLFVLEADSISASAMRNLHLKVGSHFGCARLYQVFNKATSEEFETYSKIVGTFFTNIGTLLFDWRIRQAFSRSQIPDIGNTSAQYGADLCDVCKIMFSDKAIQKGLDNFSTQLRYRKLEHERDEMEEKLYELSERRSVALRDILMSSLLCCGTFGALVLLTEALYNRVQASYAENEALWTALFFLICMGVAAVTLLIPLVGSSTFRESRRKRIECEQHLKRIKKELARLDKELEEPIPLQQDGAS